MEGARAHRPGQALDAPVSKGVIIEVQETVKKTGNSHSVDKL